MSLGELLRTVCGLLEAASVPYMVVGSLASTLHGEPRATWDVDIVIDPSRAALDELLAALPERLYADPDTARDALMRRSMFNAIDQDSGWKVDLIIRKDRPFSRAELDRRQRASIDGAEVFVASPEDTVVSKLEWAKHGESARQIDDVRRLLAMRPALDRDYIEHWVAELELGDQWAAAQR